jgi:hypothetical protein
MALIDDDSHDEVGLSGLVHLGSAGLPSRTMFAAVSENWRPCSFRLTRIIWADAARKTKLRLFCLNYALFRRNAYWAGPGTISF